MSATSRRPHRPGRLGLLLGGLLLLAGPAAAATRPVPPPSGAEGGDGGDAGDEQIRDDGGIRGLRTPR